MANTYSAHLNGSNQSLTVTNGGYYDLTTTTLECWFKLASLPSGGNGMNMLSTNEAGHGFSLQAVDQGGGVTKIKVAINGGTGHTMTGTTALSTGVWYHVAFAWNTTSAELIFNGVSDKTTNDSATLSASSQSFQVGKENVGGDRGFFQGDIDEVRVWNSKRTVAQVFSNYLSQLIGNETNLLSYWQLNNVLTDSTSGGKTLTNNNIVTFTGNVPFDSFSQSETVTVTDSNTYGTTFSQLDTVTSTDLLKNRKGFGTQTKNTSNWSNQSKN